MSNRRDKPSVTVDCTSVPSSLIESELFGHERGAYTGADQRRIGRLAEADGGTVILDEIGELPLEMQGKLLRFVQEKEIVPVGGTRARKVDARVIAVTNRNLKKEAAAGRFREDLYHRLNVVHLHIPPLPERKDDVMYLANHFLQKFSVQYQKGILRRLSGDAEQVMLRYSWPGNVRELQNRILQAVILSEGIEISREQLGLPPPTPADAETMHGDSGGGREERAEDPDGWLTTEPSDVSAAMSSWTVLRDALSKAIEASLTENGDQPVPLGKWLLNAFVLEAQAASSNVMRRGATRLGIPEATFRRRLRKAQSERDRSTPPPPFWEPVERAVKALVSEDAKAGDDRLRRARALLLEGVVERLPEDVSRASALMGVTEPTYRRWKSEVLVS
jgi:DNA-binding NtrC family response regulator